MNVAKTTTQNKQKSSQGTADKMDAGTAAGITFGITAFVGLIIAAVVIGWRRHKSVQRDSSGLNVPLNSRIGYGTNNMSPAHEFDEKAWHWATFFLFSF